MSTTTSTTHAHDEPVVDAEEARAEAEADARRRFALAQIRQYGDPALRLAGRTRSWSSTTTCAGSSSA